MADKGPSQGFRRNEVLLLVEMVPKEEDVLGKVSS